MAKSYVLSLSLCLLFLFHGCLSTQQQKQHQGQTQSQHQFRGEQRQCRIDNLDALEPTHQIEAEAGLIEYWDENNEQFQCAGVTACRITVQPKGLSLPAYYNSPKLIYIVKGKGVLGLLVPGCPETFHSFDHSRQSEDQESRRPSSKDQDSRSQGHEDVHQKLRRVKKGDIIAIPNGVAYWFFNDGDTPVVAVGIADTGNNLNQLDDRIRKFYLAGNVQEQEQQQHHQQQQQQRGSSSSGREKAEEESFGNNIFSGFDAELLVQAFGVEKETVRKLQGKNDERGRIIHVEEGLQVIRSISSEEEEEQQEQQRQNQMKANGLEESFCNMRFRQNIGKATSADVYTPFGGRVTNVNSQSLPILSFLDLSAERGYLYKNSMMSPHWNMNAHSVIYVLNGEARVQIVANYGQAVFDGQLREGQIVIIPQNFAVVKQAADNGFEWVSFKTSDNAMKSPLAGRASAIRAMPEEVLVNVYRISNEEAKRLKFNRDELIVFGPRSESY